MEFYTEDLFSGFGGKRICLQDAEEMSKKTKRQKKPVEENQKLREEFEMFIRQSKALRQEDCEVMFSEVLNNLTLKLQKINNTNELSSVFETLLDTPASKRRECKKNWIQTETTYLVSMIAYYSLISLEDFRSLSDSDWSYLAAFMPMKSASQIKKHFNKILKVDISQNPWTLQEDDLLVYYVRNFGTERKWKLIAEGINSASKNGTFRHPRQCRERWANHADPNINRGDWSAKDDSQLMSLYYDIGKKWAHIAKLLGNRTENAVRNRWNSLTKKGKEIGNFLDENLSLVENSHSAQDNQEESASFIQVDNRSAERLTLDSLVEAQTATTATSFQEFNTLPNTSCYEKIKVDALPMLWNNSYPSSDAIQSSYPSSNVIHPSYYYPQRREENYSGAYGYPTQNPREQSHRDFAINQPEYRPENSLQSQSSFNVGYANNNFQEFSQEAANLNSGVFFSLVNLENNEIKLIQRVSDNSFPQYNEIGTQRRPVGSCTNKVTDFTGCYSNMNSQLQYPYPYFSNFQ